MGILAIEVGFDEKFRYIT